MGSCAAKSAVSEPKQISAPRSRPGSRAGGRPQTGGRATMINGSSPTKSSASTRTADKTLLDNAPAGKTLLNSALAESTRTAGKNALAESTRTAGKTLLESGSKLNSSTTLLKVSMPNLHQNMFITENPGKIKDYYDIEKDPVGVGGYGSVSKGKHKSTSAVRAIKAISKLGMKDPEIFKQEIAVMKMLDHPNIIKLYETFEDQRSVYMVMELCAGGELFDRIIEAGSFSEVDAAIIMQQMIRAVYYMHERNICHRDMKPENFLFQNTESIEKNNLKIIDFGLSKVVKPGEVMTSKVGTPYYVSPQVLAGSYCLSSDIWSCGVIMFVLLCGCPPFGGETDAEILAAVRKGTFSFSGRDWKGVTDDAKILIRNMLKMDVKQRFTAAQVLNHSWIKDKAPKAIPGVKMQGDFVNHLRGFQSANHLKKAALHIIAGELSEKQIKSLRDTFVALDANGDGLLTVDEIRSGLKSGGLKELPLDLNQIVADVDGNGSGVIDYTEFLAATLQKRLYIQEDVCWKAFSTFDKNGDGQITPEELKQVLGNGSVEDALGAASIEHLLREVDGNGDGMIDFKEFMHMMHSHGTPCHREQATPKARLTFAI